MKDSRHGIDASRPSPSMLWTYLFTRSAFVRCTLKLSVTKSSVGRKLQSAFNYKRSVKTFNDAQQFSNCL